MGLAGHLGRCLRNVCGEYFHFVRISAMTYAGHYVALLLVVGLFSYI